MAKKGRSGSNYELIDLVSYIAIILIGIALFITMLSALGVTFLNSIAGTCSYIAQIISYAILLWNSYYFAIRKGSKHYQFVIWLIIVIIIIVSFFFGNFWAMFK